MIRLATLVLVIFFNHHLTIDARFIYKKFVGTMHQQIIRSNLSVGCNGTTLNADIDVLQPLHTNFYIRASLSEFGREGKKLLVITPRLPYCKVLGIATNVPIVSDVIKESLKFGNFPTTCPIQPGHYYMEDFYVNDTKLPIQNLMKNGDQYVVETWFWDKLKKKVVQIFKYDVILQYILDE